MKINWKEPSTKRAIVWIGFTMVALPAWVMGREISELLLLATAVVGGLGLLPDKA